MGFPAWTPQKPEGVSRCLLSAEVTISLLCRPVKVTNNVSEAGHSVVTAPPHRKFPIVKISKKNIAMRGPDWQT